MYAADGSCISHHNRLTVCDKTSGMTFLIDTGANVSVIAVDKNRLRKYNSDKWKFNLYAANGTLIKTYGIRTLSLNLGLRRPYTWNFIIAEVEQPIGADFLSQNKLLVDLSGRRFLDLKTSLSVIG